MEILSFNKYLHLLFVEASDSADPGHVSCLQGPTLEPDEPMNELLELVTGKRLSLTGCAVDSGYGLQTNTLDTLVTF